MMNTYYSIDKASYYGPEYQETIDTASFQEEFEKLWKACETLLEGGLEYGICPAWDGLIDAMDHVKSIEQLRDLMHLLSAHGPTCNHSAAVKESNRKSLLDWCAADAALVTDLPVLVPQCAACMCDRKDVVSDRLVLGKPSVVCCGEVA